MLSKDIKNFFCFVIILVMAFFCPSSLIAQSSVYHDFRTLLTDIKEAVAEQNVALALDLLEEAHQMLNQLEERPILAEEALRWDLAQLNLDRAESMQNIEQIAYFANESVKRWLEYIEWYRNMEEPQRKIIKELPNSDRIQKAVRQLGNAIMRRDNIPPYTVRDLFALYQDLPVEYLSFLSVRLWRNYLFRCPSWKQVQSQNIRELKTKFESVQNTCRDDWEDFASFLEEWIEKQTLSASNKRIIKRWLRDLRYALGYENG